MNLSRKEFFKKSLFSLGEAVSAVSGAVAPQLETETEQHDIPFVPREESNLLAQAHNGRCLARNCGCFVCVERCEVQAIQIVMGEGIRIDAVRCNGCGTCEYVCPVTPKAIVLAERSTA